MSFVGTWLGRFVGDWLGSVGGENQASNWKPLRHRDHDVERRNREYRAAIKRKQDYIIELRKEAQEALLAKRELESADKLTKQIERQIAAAIKRENELRQAIADAMQALAELESKLLIFQQQQSLLVFQMAYPFLNINIGGSHA